MPSVEEEVNGVSPRINWDNYSPIKLREYSLMSDICLSRVSIPNEAIECNDINCNIEDHISKIRFFNENISKSLADASNAVLGVKKSKTFDCKPGFNEHVKELHDVARKRFVAWREANKPRDPNNPFLGKLQYLGPNSNLH